MPRLDVRRLAYLGESFGTGWADAAVVSAGAGADGEAAPLWTGPAQNPDDQVLHRPVPALHRSLHRGSQRHGLVRWQLAQRQPAEQLGIN